MDAGKTISASFPVSVQELGKSDRIALNFEHKDYPVTLMFASRSPYVDNMKAEAPGLLNAGVLDGKFSVSKINDDYSLYEVSFCGTAYRRDMSSTGIRQFAKDVDNKSWYEYFKKVFTNLVDYSPRVEVGRDGVEAVEFAEDGTCLIKYNNGTDSEMKPRVSVFALNEFGAVVGKVDEVWKFKKLKPGCREDSNKLKFTSPARVKYIDVETAH